MYLQIQKVPSKYHSVCVLQPELHIEAVHFSKDKLTNFGELMYPIEKEVRFSSSVTCSITKFCFGPLNLVVEERINHQCSKPIYIMLTQIKLVLRSNFIV